MQTVKRPCFKEPEMYCYSGGMPDVRLPHSLTAVGRDADRRLDGHIRPTAERTFRQVRDDGAKEVQ